MAEIDELEKLVEQSLTRLTIVFKSNDDLDKAKKLIIDNVRDVSAGNVENDFELVLVFDEDDITKDEVIESVNNVLKGAEIDFRLVPDPATDLRSN